MPLNLFEPLGQRGYIVEYEVVSTEDVPETDLSTRPDDARSDGPKLPRDAREAQQREDTAATRRAASDEPGVVDK